MEKNIKENIRKAIIDFDNKTFKVSEYGNIIGRTKKALYESLQSGDIDKASKDYEKFKNDVLVPYTEQAFNEVIKKEEDTIIDEPIDFVEDNVDIGNTLFMKPINSNVEVVEETKEEVSSVPSKNDEDLLSETREFELEGSFILPKEEFDFKIEKPISELKEEYKDLPMFTPDDQLDDEIEETKEITKPKTKKKSISFKKKKERNAAYVDTVILCLIAQLSIFGLLIIVLLIIK